MTLLLNESDNVLYTPSGWSIKKIKDVTQKGASIKPESEPDRIYGYIDISAINNQTNQIVEFKQIRGSEAPSRARQPIQVNDVLFSNVRTYLKNIAIVPENLDVHVCSTGFTVLRSNELILPKFLFFYTLTDSFINKVTPQQTGSQYPATTDRVVRAVEIPLPPLPEQHRIVAKVEELFKEVDAAHDRLKKVPEILKHFRQAVLAAACSGRLTEGWRDEHSEFKNHKDCQDTPETIDGTTVLQVNEIPGSWSWSKLGNVTLSMRNGIYKESKYYSETGFPCLRMYNIENGKIIWKNIKRMNLLDEEIEQYLLTPGDILINRVNSRELVGKSALITDKIEPCVYESKNIRLRVNSEKVNSNFVVFWLQLTAQQFFNLNAQQTVGMASINQDQISSMPIPVPPLKEQHEIVRRVESLFALADDIERQVVAATKRTDGLRQAILAKAFRGELVPTEAELSKGIHHEG